MTWFLLLACSSPFETPLPSLTGEHGDAQRTTGAARVALLSPGDGETVNNPVTFELSAQTVYRVHLQADGWTLGDPWNPRRQDTHTYTFSGTGTPRVVTLEGLDVWGNVVVSDTITITVLDPSEPAADPATTAFRDVPYYSQYDNRYEPSSTCGLTSAAMLLDSWHGSGFVTPDQLYVAYGKGQGQSPSTLAQLYAWEGLASRSGTRATRQDLRDLLDAGRPVVVHGFWTSAGHIAVLTGHDANGWIVNDPAGDWYSGYGSGVRADGIHYDYGSAWDDDLSWDGDIWWSAADVVTF